jgi:tetrahydromethanopterin S-methyltransferase subunit D
VICDPQVADPVHYVPDGGGPCLAALVTAVEPDTVGLAVFRPAHTERVAGVHHDPQRGARSWHWPHR